MQRVLLFGLPIQGKGDATNMVSEGDALGYYGTGFQPVLPVLYMLILN